MTTEKHREPEEYQCEICGSIIKTPAAKETYRYPRETVVLAFCGECVE